MAQKMDLFDEAKRKMPMAIVGFRGRYYWLSNDYLTKVEWEGVVYPSVSHAFAASGTNDVNVRERIRLAEDFSTVRELERMMTKNYAVEMNRIDILAQLIRLKFTVPELRKGLKNTKEQLLVHHNERGDTIWGVCNNRGYNLLGRVLMEVRSLVISEDARIYSGPEK